MYHSSTLPIQQIGAASSALYKLRGDIYKFILLPDERSSIRQAIEQDFAAVNEQIDLYRANQLTQEETEALKQFDNAWTLYQRMARDIVSKVESGDDQAALDSIKTGSELSSVRKALDDAMNNLIEINRAHAEELDTMGDNTVQNILRILIIASVVGVLLAMGLGLVITRSINTPLAIMAGGLQKLAQGDLNRDIAQEVKDAIMGRRDEIGIAGKGLGQTELYLQEMAEVASRIASGDLTVKVTPKCEKDEFGHAFGALADEYQNADDANADFYDLSVEPWEPNITTLVDFGKKWKFMVDKKTPIPTPAIVQTNKKGEITYTYENQIGAFEGAGYRDKGIYRPTLSCIMRDFNKLEFCPVCQYAIKQNILFQSSK